VQALLLATTIVSWLQAVPAQAQAMRTFVSGLGEDTNACTETAPCQTLQVALANTLPGGQIYALDSANYGFVTIDKAISIISGSGATGILATSSVTGITISASANDTINLQGLDIDGAGSGADGIQFNSGASLYIQDSVIRGFTNGINFQPSGSSALSVDKTLVSNNSTGIKIQNSLMSTGVLNDVQLVNNGTGIVAQGGSGTGPAIVTIQNSIVANNSAIGVLSGGFSVVSVANSTIANNGIGLQAQTASAVLQVSESTVTGNGTGMAANAGQIISYGNSSIGGNAIGNTSPPTTDPVSPPPPPSPAITYNITNYAACNGVANDHAGFMNWNAAVLNWQATHSGLVQLNIPSGRTCCLTSSSGTTNVGYRIKQLLVVGDGATITDTCNGTTGASGFTFGDALGGICQIGIASANGCSARIATVSSGSSTVTLLDSALKSRFTVGGWAIVTGFDLQGGQNYPPNFQYFDYVKVTAISGATITFTPPLTNNYKSTWPLYNAGNSNAADAGGPATIYALDPAWDTEVEIRGVTLYRAAAPINSNGRLMTFNQVNFSTSRLCVSPSQNLIFTFTNVTGANCGIELDKLVDQVIFNNVTMDSFDAQSGSVNSITADKLTIRIVNGTPKRAVFTNSTFTSDLRVGAIAYGRSDSFSCTNCVIANLSPGGVAQSDLAGDSGYTMSGGVIRVPYNNSNAPRWNVPGTNIMWTGAYDSQLMFQVVDVTQDIATGDSLVQTSLAGGFPVIPLTGGKFGIKVHPAPVFTCTNCTGNEDVVDLSQAAAAGRPLYSYTSRTYTGNTLGTAGNPTQSMKSWGWLSSFSIDVTTPFTGTEDQLSYSARSPFKNYPTLKSDGSVCAYSPIVNLNNAGNRVITPAGVTGNQPGDGTLSVADFCDVATTWFQGNTGIGASRDVSGQSPTVSPTVTITIMTDQGVVIPPP
jgi:hypothetical protein